LKGSLQATALLLRLSLKIEAPKEEESHSLIVKSQLMPFFAWKDLGRVAGGERGGIWRKPAINMDYNNMETGAHVIKSKYQVLSILSKGNFR
jgi:hypothetical protein